MLRCNPKANAQCPDRHLCGPIEDKPMTNGDSVRGMSDKELVEFIGHNSLCDRIQREGTWCEEHAVCENCLTVWLQQPAKEGDHERS